MSDGRRALEAVRAFPGALALVGRDGRLLLTSRAWAAADSPARGLLGGTTGPGDPLPEMLRKAVPAGGSEIAERIMALLTGEGGAAAVRGVVAAAEEDGGAGRIRLEAHPLEIAGERAALVLLVLEPQGTGPPPDPPASAHEASRRAPPPPPEPEAPEPPGTPGGSAEGPPPSRPGPHPGGEAETGERLVEALGDVAFEVAPDGSEVRYVSPGWEELWGLPREALYRRPAALLDGVHPHDRERLARALRRLDEAPLSARFRVVRPDGRTHWVWGRSRPWSPDDEWVSGIFTDVTAQARRETALAEAVQETRRRHAGHRAVFESSGLGIAVLDREGEVVEANRALAGLLGWEGTSPPEGGASLSALLGDGPGRMAEACRDVAREGSQGWIREVRLDRGEGGPVDLRVRLAPTDARDGLCVLLVEDVSDRRGLVDQQAQAQRIESLGRLAGGIAHDFNNLVTVIRGHAELLLDRVADAADRQALEEIRVAGDRAARLTSQLLSFSRRNLLRPRLVDLNDVIAGIEELLRLTLGESAELRLSPGAGLPPVLVDPPQLEQALLNLVMNARDAMDGRGEVQIRTFTAELDHDFVRTHPGSTAGLHVAVSVRDTGRGMDDEVRARVFEPFFTTKPPGEGSGLGLPMAYGLVKQSDGYIEVRSTAGKGSTFTIYLPAAEAPGEGPGGERDRVREPRPRYRTPEAASGRAATILVVEDDPMVQLIARKVLESRGYRVLTAGSGEEALAVSGSLQGPIDLLLSDVVLPGMTSGELWQRLRKDRPATGVLLMSGYADDAVVRHGVVEGETPFIPKPFTPDELAARVEEVLEGR